jgi:uncharacterized protein YsxB (DUF464 family)
MVRICVQRDAQGRLMGLQCSGHAGFSDDEHGGDLVCAAVSALTGYLGITVSQVLGWPEAVVADDGFFTFVRPSAGSASQRAALDVILQGWLLSVQALEENYSGWVKVEETEL